MNLSPEQRACLDPDPTTRAISANLPHSHRPETLAEWIGADHHHAAGGARQPLRQSDRGRHQPGALAQAQPAAGPDPAGHRFRQDDRRHHGDLPLDQVQRRPPGALPGGPQQPRQARLNGVPEVLGANHPRFKALGRVPVLSSIVHTLQEKENRTMRSDFFLGIWDDYFPLQEAERQLATTVDWGRYAELFEYDAIEGRLYLPS